MSIIERGQTLSLEACKITISQRRNFTAVAVLTSISIEAWALKPPTFASTSPIREPNGSDVRRPSSSDSACSAGADNVRVAPKASDAAEHTKHICSRPHPSLSKCFRRPMVGLVCSCFYNKQKIGNGDGSSCPITAKLLIKHTIC